MSSSWQRARTWIVRLALRYPALMGALMFLFLHTLSNQIYYTASPPPGNYCCRAVHLQRMPFPVAGGAQFSWHQPLFDCQKHTYRLSCFSASCRYGTWGIAFRKRPCRYLQGGFAR